MNTIYWTNKARKQLLKVKDVIERGAIYDAVGELAGFPNVSQVTKLTSHQHGYRLRVGQWRVLFDFDGAVRVISIEEIKRRNERTY